MSDDPREVLALLNSLGFVGITGQQLKDFMKDLKLYRKAKERERQQKKEEIKRKIIEKQQNAIKDVFRERNREFCSAENTVSSDFSNSYADHSLVKVKVKCLSNDKENKESANYDRSCAGRKQKLDAAKATIKNGVDSIVESRGAIRHDENVIGRSKDRNKYSECLKQESYMIRKFNTKAGSGKMRDSEKPATPQTVRPTSAPSILHRDDECVGSSQTKSVVSAKTAQSGAKSFIRPWRLQLEAQKALSARKSDPVMLYQKYQQEWKQMSFPGEAKHTNLRWAIREKMLGGDPHPMPVPRKSTSMPTLKKK